MFSEANSKEGNRIKSLNISTAEKIALLKPLLERDSKERAAYEASPEGKAVMAEAKRIVDAMSLDEVLKF